VPEGKSVIRKRQADYYKVLAACDKAGNSNAFIEFLLAAILTALSELATPEVGLNDIAITRMRTLLSANNVKRLK